RCDSDPLRRRRRAGTGARGGGPMSYDEAVEAAAEAIGDVLGFEYSRLQNKPMARAAIAAALPHLKAGHRAVADADPRRTEAEGKAEALEEEEDVAAEHVRRSDWNTSRTFDKRAGTIQHWPRARAARLREAQQ